MKVEKIRRTIVTLIIVSCSIWAGTVSGDTNAYQFDPGQSTVVRSFITSDTYNLTGAFQLTVNVNSGSFDWVGATFSNDPNLETGDLGELFYTDELVGDVVDDTTIEFELPPEHPLLQSYDIHITVIFQNDQAYLAGYRNPIMVGEPGYTLEAVANLVKIVYVDADAPGGGDGSNWANAYNYLQDALADADSSAKPVEIRVAEGIYKPDLGIRATPGDREETFQLINEVTIKGGYAGKGQPNPDSRDISLYDTILSGDLIDDDGLNFTNNDENSYHVVTATGTDETAALDGFTITAGNADGNDWSNYQHTGGGMYNNSASPTVINCTFSKNFAVEYGGGIYNLFSNPIVTGCTFNANTTTKGGGGMCNISSSPKVTNCTFSGNSAASYGGGLYGGSPTLTNCTFTGNSSERGGGIFGGTGLMNECTIIGNTADYGGGLYSCSGQITNCIISGNLAQVDGGGMSNCFQPILSNCTISDNSAGNCGGGICNHGDTVPRKSTLISCTVSGNSAKYGGGIYNIENGHATLRSSILTGNTAELGAAIYSGGWTSATLTNCTLSGNSADDSGGAIFNYDQLTLTNCILWGNIPDEIIGITGSQLQKYNNITGGCPGVGNIDVDPCFVQPGHWDVNGIWVEGDYHLMFDSLCINAGDPNYTPEPNETDLDGNPRLMGGRIDMGAYESTKQAFLFQVEPESVIIPEGQTANFEVSLQSDPEGIVEVAVSLFSGDPDITIESGEILTFDTSNYSIPQTVTLGAAEDADPYEGTALIWVDAPGFVLVVVKATEGDNETASSILYVDANATGANDGTGWSDAFTDLQNAFIWAAFFPHVEEIRVAKGTYTPDLGIGIEPGDRTATFQLINGVTIKGGYAGFGEPDPDARDVILYETILSGDLKGDDEQILNPQDLLDAPCRADNSYHVLAASGTDETAVLYGLTITAGNANGSTDPDQRGGGIFNDLATSKFTNCTFTGNAAYRHGGAMYNYKGGPNITNCNFRKNSGGAMSNDDSNPTVSGCSFTDNYAGSGGAIYNGSNSSSIFINCVFSDNFAIGGSGGAITNGNSSPIFINCTLRQNYASGKGGGIYNISDGNPTLDNCTFSSNSSEDHGGGICNYYSSPTLMNCKFSSNSSHEHGGGIYNYRSSPTLMNCKFSGNTSINNGGGIYNRYNSSPTVTNSIFSGNSATYGGGIYNHSNSIVAVTNCTFTGNSAVNGKALVCDSEYQRYPSDVDVTNCILWEGGKEIWNNDGSTITITYSDFQGGWLDEGNIDADPLFVDADGIDNIIGTEDDNLCLLSDSPCINGGDNSVVTVTTDLEGNPRIVNGTVDMGAYEFWGPVHVDDDAPNDPGPGDPAVSDPLENGTEDHPFDTIQEGLNAAKDGYTVLVRQGSYFEPTPGSTIDFLGKNITLKSEDPTDWDTVDNTIIRGYVQFSGTEEQNCTFTGFNIRDLQYGAIYGNHTHATISYCNISGNGPCGATAIRDCDGTISNCLITDNTTVALCGIYPVVFGCNGSIKNCTIVNNVSGVSVGTATIENCIIYNNTGSQLAVTNGNTVNISYSNIQDGLAGVAGDGNVVWGPGNIDTDPCFVRLGYWAIDEVTLIEGDYHLRSEGWRWNTEGQSWTYDFVTSRCADAGNPGAALRDELLSVPRDPNNVWGVNLRINMGAYGGTNQASMPPHDWALSADLNNDGTVNFVDFAYQTQDWLTTAPEQPGDVNRDRVLNMMDLALLAEGWLKMTVWAD